MQTWGIADFSQIRSSIVPSFQGLLRFLTFPALFDATTYLTRASDFTSNANTNFFLCSFWFNISSNSSGAGVSKIIYVNSSDFGTEGTVSVVFSGASGRISVNGFNSTAFVPVFSAQLGTTAANSFSSVSNLGWHNVLVSVSATGSRFYAYIDNVAVTPTSTTVTALTIDYTRTEHQFGSGTSSGKSLGLVNIDIAQFYLNTQSYLDLSQSSNRLLFRTQSGGPADMGASGATPTASSPMIYLTGPASIWNNNVGYGGAFTVAAGALTNSTTVPSG